MNNEREYLLTDKAAGDIAWDAYKVSSSPELGGIAVRNYYERLITEGKLRVMEEVDNFMSPYPIAKEVFGCSNCQTVFDRHTKHSKHGRIRVIKFCPGCGNKIKR